MAERNNERDEPAKDDLDALQGDVDKARKKIEPTTPMTPAEEAARTPIDPKQPSGEHKEEMYPAAPASRRPPNTDAVTDPGKSAAEPRASTSPPDRSISAAMSTRTLVTWAVSLLVAVFVLWVVLGFLG